MPVGTPTTTSTGTHSTKMKKPTLLFLGMLLLGGIVSGCTNSQPAEAEAKPGDVKVTGGGQAPPPEAASTATRPQNPFEAAGVGGPGMKKGKGGPAVPGGQ